MDAGCLTVSGFLLALFLARCVLGQLMPKRIQVLLWAAAALLLLFPLGLTSRWSFYGLFRPPVHEAPAPVSSGSCPALPVWIHLGGTLLLGLAAGGSYGLGLLRLHRGIKLQTPWVKDWQAAHPLLRPLRIMEGPVSAPVCGGILFPVIVLPRGMAEEDPTTLDCVMTHEYLHICHLDPLLKLLLLCVLCLRWYNPLVWVLWVLAGRDMEYACDEAVLAAGTDPRLYSIALLRAELRKANSMGVLPGFNAGQTGRRLDRIRRRGSIPLRRWVLAILISGLLLLSFGTAPGQEVLALSGKRILPDPAQRETVFTDRVLAPESGPQSPAILRACQLRVEAWHEEVRSWSNPYRGYIELGRYEQVPLDQVTEAMRSLRSQTGADYLQVAWGRDDTNLVVGYTLP